VTDILPRVIDLVREVYGIEDATADTVLDGDGIGRVLLADGVEKAFGVVLPARAEERWTTVADIVAAVEKARRA